MTRYDNGLENDTRMISSATSSNQPRRRQALHLIAYFEALKGLLALAGAGGLGYLGPDPLRRSIASVIERFELDPDHGPLPSLLRLLDPSMVRLAAVFLVIYAGLRIWEAWGLWRMRAWASVLGCFSAAIYLPIDIYAVVHHPGWTSWLVLVINIAVVIFLVLDLRARRSKTGQLK